MMRVKLVGAGRASFKGAADIIVRGGEVDVDDKTGEQLLSRNYLDTAGNLHPLWELVKGTAPEAAAPVVNADLDENGEDANEGIDASMLDPEPEEEEPAEPAPKPKTRRKAASRARKKTAS